MTTDKITGIFLSQGFRSQDTQEILSGTREHMNLAHRGPAVFGGLDYVLYDSSRRPLASITILSSFPSSPGEDEKLRVALMTSQEPGTRQVRFLDAEDFLKRFQEKQSISKAFGVEWDAASVRKDTRLFPQASSPRTCMPG